MNENPQKFKVFSSNLDGKFTILQSYNYLILLSKIPHYKGQNPMQY